MSTKTNAVRIVEHAKIPCKEIFYTYSEDDWCGIHAAASIQLPAEQVFKTLVARGPRTGINVFCIPVCCSLDLKKAAKAAGDKSIEMIHVKELLSLTGYIRGGCSPVGMKKKYPVYLHNSCLDFEEIAVSAGERGHQMILPPLPLIALISGETADITITERN